jgi:glycosyltransferase involved in cell wall biosynthesis
MPQPELSIIVPCYNEAENLPYIIEGFDAVVRTHTGVEVLLVNNGSTDNSAQVMENLLAALPHRQIKMVTVPVNQGYGYGILYGLKQAAADVLAWTHADGQTDPTDVITAWQKFRELNNPLVVVKGKRKNRALAAALFTWGMQCIANLMLKTRLTDINAQPKLFSRVFYEKIVNRAPHDFSLDVYWLFQAQKTGQIVTIPVVFKKRLYGQAKGGGSFRTRIKLVKRTFGYLRKLKKQLSE